MGGGMFQQLLKEFVDRTEGGIASVLMGFDGIPVEQYVKEDADVNVESIGMEYGVVLNQIRQAAEMLEIGDAREVAIQAAQVTTVIRLLSDEYFVALAVKPDGNFGKARYLLRVGAHKLLEGLV
jgi:predicted regulator of Ras-like GTPase activity (Roadblock/LC7/MglB family)